MAIRKEIIQNIFHCDRLYKWTDDNDAPAYILECEDDNFIISPNMKHQIFSQFEYHIVMQYKSESSFRIRNIIFDFDGSIIKMQVEVNGDLLEVEFSL